MKRTALTNTALTTEDTENTGVAVLIPELSVSSVVHAFFMNETTATTGNMENSRVTADHPAFSVFSVVHAVT